MAQVCFSLVTYYEADTGCIKESRDGKAWPTVGKASLRPPPWCSARACPSTPAGSLLHHPPQGPAKPKSLEAAPGHPAQPCLTLPGLLAPSKRMLCMYRLCSHVREHAGVCRSVQVVGHVQVYAVCAGMCSSVQACGSVQAVGHAQECAGCAGVCRYAPACLLALSVPAA